MLSFYEPSEIDEVLRRTGFSNAQLLDTRAVSERCLPVGAQLRLPGAAIFAIATV